MKPVVVARLSTNWDSIAFGHEPVTHQVVDAAPCCLAVC